MHISNKEEAVIILLHRQEIAYGAKVIPQVQIAGRSDAAYYDLSFHNSSIKYQDTSIMIEIKNQNQVSRHKYQDEFAKLSRFSEMQNYIVR